MENGIESGNMRHFGLMQTIEIQRCQPKKIKIREILDPKSKLFKVELGQFNHKNASNIQKFPPRNAKIGENMSEKLILCAFLRIVREI